MVIKGTITRAREMSILLKCMDAFLSVYGAFTFL
jgi:hypothetical protein